LTLCHGDVTGVVPLHLESSNIQATIVHAAAEVIVTQTYVNNSNEQVDTFYYFPMRLEDAVTDFEVKINDIVIKVNEYPIFYQFDVWSLC
jgi:hypothetical protein